jgi:hypothetical protein
VIVTTPGAGLEVGQRFVTDVYDVAPPSTWPDWLVRLVAPPSPNGGNAHNVGVESAEAELALAQRLGLVHPSLAAEPHERAAA